MSMAVGFFFVTFSPHWPSPIPLLSSGELLSDTLVPARLPSAEYCFVSYDSCFTNCVFPGTLIHWFISLTVTFSVKHHLKVLTRVLNELLVLRVHNKLEASRFQYRYGPLLLCDDYILADRCGSVLPRLGQLVELLIEAVLLLEFFLISYITPRSFRHSIM